MRVKRILKWMLWAGLALGLILALTAGALYWHFSRDLPPVEQLRQVHFQVPLRIYTREGDLIGSFGEQRRIPVAVSDMPQAMRDAMLASEDARFFEHPGVDWQGISRAVINVLTSGDRSIGGSTITQQLARNLFTEEVGFEKTYTRKAREALLALKIERELDKRKILELYMNKIYLGNRAYGVGAAAQVYYGKTLDELTLAETAMIAGLPQRPSRINPIDQPELAVERRNYVLGRMLELGHISAEAHENAINEPDRAYYHGADLEMDAPYVAEMARAEMVRRFGEAAYSDGLNVYTTVSTPLQKAARQALRDGLFAYDLRHGYRGPEAAVELQETDGPAQWREALAGFEDVAGLKPGLVVEADPDMALVYLADGQTVSLDLDAVRWARPFINRNAVGPEPDAVSAVVQTGHVVRLARNEEGGWRLSQRPEVQAALVSLDPESGGIRALVGGLDFSMSKFNRATQSRRQPGSSFKPFVYSAALERGYTTASVVNDAPVVYRNQGPDGEDWKPQNSSQTFYGPTRLREAMVNSRNLVSIRLLEDIGISFARDYISRFGIPEDELPRDLSMALGSATLTPISLAEGYATFANGGHKVNAYLVDSVQSISGEILLEANPAVVCRECRPYPEVTAEKPVRKPPRISNLPDSPDPDDGESPVIPQGPPIPRVAEQIISPQNAYLVTSMMKDVIRRGTGKKALALERDDIAGKTGTTNDQRDAWFSGFNPDLVSTVWVGFDDHQEALGRREFGGDAALPIWIDFMETALAGRPDQERELPDGLAMARIDPESGKLAASTNPDAIMEWFADGTLPPMEESTRSIGTKETEIEDPYGIY